MKFTKYFILYIISVMVLSGCSLINRWVYRPNINQGNYITTEQTYKLKKGLTKEQVIFIMGSPMLTSTFENDVWHYIFRELPLHGKLKQLRYSIHFDKNNRVKQIESSEINDNN